jgi:septal ring factor EnvC (AmiA/AmiB activator)
MALEDEIRRLLAGYADAQAESIQQRQVMGDVINALKGTNNNLLMVAAESKAINRNLKDLVREVAGTKLAVQHQAKESEEIATQLETTLRILRSDVEGAKGAAEGARGAADKAAGAAEGARGAADKAADEAQDAAEAAFDAREETRRTRLARDEHAGGWSGFASRVLASIIKRPWLILGLIGLLLAAAFLGFSLYLVEIGRRPPVARTAAASAAAAALHAPAGAKGSP